MADRAVEFFVSWFFYPGISITSLLLGTGLAVAFGAFWFAAYWTPVLKQPRAWAVLVGSAILSLVAISFIQLPLQYASGMLLLRFWSNDTLMQWLPLAGIPQVLLTGLVQEGSKMAPVAICWWRAGRSLEPRMGLALGAVAGAGLGIFEALWAHNRVLAAGWDWGLVQSHGFLALATFWERFFVIAMHIAASALAGYGLAKGKGWRFYLLAALIHSLANYSAILVSAGAWGVVQLEIYIAAVALLATAAALWLRWRRTEELAAE